MPRANWGVDASDVDDFDRSSQFTPYAGPPVPTGVVYLWRIKQLKYVAATKDKLPQLRVGLELVPRDSRPGEAKYKDYFNMAFLPVSDKTRFRYVPLLDALGVSGKEFAQGTVTDAEGNITKIGRWKNSGEELVCGLLKAGTDQDGNARNEIGSFLPANEDDEEDDFAEGDEDGEEYFEDEDE